MTEQGAPQQLCGSCGKDITGNAGFYHPTTNMWYCSGTCSAAAASLPESPVTFRHNGFESTVDRMAQHVIDTHPGSTLSAAYRAVALKLSLPESQPDVAKALANAQKAVKPLVEQERKCEDLSGLDGIRFKSSKGMNQAETFAFLLSRHRRLLEIESQPSPSGDYEKEAEQFWETWGWEGWRSNKRDIKLLADFLRAHDAKVGQAEQGLRTLLHSLCYQVRISNALDDHGHALVNLKALHEAEAALKEPR